MQETNTRTPKKAPVIILSVLLAATIGVLIFIWSRGGGVSAIEEGYSPTDTFAMGSVVQQTVFGDPAKREQAARDAASAVQQLENLVSWRSEDSDVANINNAAGTSSVKVDSRTLDIIKTAMDVAEKTNGAFDPTILPISFLWNFDEETHLVPSQEDISSFLPNVGYQNLTYDETASTVTLAKQGSAIDLGSIGKGAGCDVAIKAYQDAGATHGIVAVGGSVGVFGVKVDNKPWSVYVRNPSSQENKSASMGILEIDSGFVSTSGTYEKTFEKDGVTYHHILDPKTGYPVETDLLSVTVACDNGALSDALSTACLILGREKAQDLLNQYNAGGIFIDKENKVYVTDALKDSFTVTANEFTLMP